MARRLHRKDIRRSENSGWLWIATLVGGIFRSFYQGIRRKFRWGPLGRPLRVEGTVRLPDVDWSQADGSMEGVNWLEDARAEHASAATFARLSLELMSLGAPSALVKTAHVAALDELAHADLCFAVAGRLLGREFHAGVLACHGPLRTTHRTIALDALVDGCLGEGFGAAVAAESARRALRADHGEMLTRIAADEHRHAELAWAVLAWAVEAGGPTVAAAVRARLPLLPVNLGGTWRLDPHESAAMWAAVRADVVERAERLLSGESAYVSGRRMDSV